MPFKGITNLRDANENVRIEKWQAEEIRKCARDLHYFVENYVYINTKDHGMQLFKTRDYQKKVLNSYRDNRFNILKFPRQSGKSITTMAYLLWYGMFHKDKVVVILANKLDLAQEQLGHLRDAYIQLPFWLQPGVIKWNKRSIQFSHKTRIGCYATSADTVRGMSINMLYLDEFAFVKSHIADEFIASVFPSISSGFTTKVIMTSCVTKDTYIFTNEGIKQIENFIEPNRPIGGYEIPEYNVVGMRDTLNTGILMHNGGNVKTRKIITSYSDVECSLVHKFWACQNGEYKKVKSKNLKVGDYVAVKYGMNCWGNDKIDFIDPTRKYKLSNRLGNIEYLTEDLAYVIGLYISEGNASNKPSKGVVDITCGDDLTHSLDKIGLRYSLAPDNLHYRISSTSLINLLLHLGFDITNRAPKKEIPPRLMRISKKCTSAMIQGIMDGDGTVPKDRYRVAISLSSKKLIHQLRILFINYGILSTYTEGITPPTKLVKVESQFYAMEVSKYDHVKTYFEEIGFRFNRKMSVFESFNAPKRKGHKDDIIPHSVQKLKEFKKIHKISHDIISFSGEHKKNQHWSRYKINEIKSKLESTMDLSGTIFDESKPDMIWVPITSIEESRNDVYDFSLNNIDGDKWCHSVVYNGLVNFQTPQGMNHFFRMWEDALGDYGETDEGNGFIRSEIKWNEVPGRSEDWAKKERRRIGEIRFNQEYLCINYNEIITIRNKNTGVVEKISIGDFYEKLKEKIKNIKADDKNE